MSTHDVRCPRDRTPIYPALCPGCLGSAPDDVFSVRRTRFSWLMVLSPLLELLLPNRTARVEIPACRSCVARMRREHLRRGCAALVCCALAVTLALWLGPGLGRTSRWFWLALGAIAFSPVMVFDVFVSPRTFDISVWKSSIDYEFKNAAYARAFAELNDGRVG